MSFPSQAERKKAIAEYVRTMVQHAEDSTRPDRERFELANALFNGKHVENKLQDGDDAMSSSLSKVFLHVISKIVRSAAASFQDLIVQAGEFYDLDPPEGEEPDAFLEIVRKIWKHRVRELDLGRFIYEYSITGGTFGLGVYKLSPRFTPVYKPQFIIERIDAQQEKARKRSSSKIADSDDISELTEEEIQSELETKFNEAVGEKGRERGQAQRVLKGVKELNYSLGLENIDPRFFYFDPKVKDPEDSSWKAYKYYATPADLYPLVERGMVTTSVFKELGKSENSTGGAETTTVTREGYSRQTKDQLENANPYATEHEVIEYFGPLLEKGTGRILEERRWYIVVDGHTVLFDGVVEDWSSSDPLGTTRFSITPFKAYGAGIADGAMSQQVMVNAIMGLYLDHLMFSILGVKAVNVDNLEHPEQLENGFTPGMAVLLNGTRPAKDSFHDLDYNSNLAFPVIQILQMLDQSAEAAATVDVQNANPSSRARISASEINANINRSLKTEAVVAREIDETLITQVLKRTLSLVLQYDFELPQLERLMSAGVINQPELDLLKSIPKEERFRETHRNYRMRVKGFREQINQANFQARLSEAISQLVQIPEADSKINWSEVIEVYCDAFRMPSQRIVRQSTPRDQAKEENALLAQERFIQALPDDPHPDHLLAHYDAALKGPNQALIAHIQGHIQESMQQTGGFPPPPDELVEVLGLGDQGGEAQGAPPGGAPGVAAQINGAGVQ